MISKSRSSPQPAPDQVIDLYLHLARAAGQHRNVLQQDKFLLLAACAAQEREHAVIANHCRSQILEHNPNHLLKRFATMEDAAASSDVQEYRAQVARVYPFEKGEYLLARFRASGYGGDHEFSDLLQVPSTSTKRRMRRIVPRSIPDAEPPVESAAKPNDESFEPIPLDWPGATGPSSPSVAALWVLAGFLAGFVLGVLVSPRILTVVSEVFRGANG